MNSPDSRLQPVACLDPAIGLSLLFRPLGNVSSRAALDVSYQLDEDRTLRFSAREALGAREQTTLLALLSLARQYPDSDAQFTILNQAHSQEPGRSLIRALSSDLVIESSTIMLSFSWTLLNERCGVGAGGSATEVQRECLRRLCEVVVWEEVGKRRFTAQSYLMVWLVGDDKRVHVALNARLAAVFLGAQYVQVPLSERGKLSTDVQKLTHAFLCTAIRPGFGLPIAPPTLVQRLWSDNADAPPGTQRRRLGDVRFALQAVGRLPGWAVAWTGNVAHISRPTLTSVRVPTMQAPDASSVREQPNEEKLNKNKGLSGSDVSGLFK